ncbi:MAG: hypothetical protein HZA53_09255 [Planctomycetes bacterium]|nr:hypothetical protein [Planctomycetota bacterium]
MELSEDPDRAPDPAQRALDKARAWNEAQQWERAEKEAAAGLALDPESAWLEVELARSCMGREQWAEAEQSLRRALAIDAECAPALLLLCVIETELARYVEAEQHALAALRVDPEWSFAYVCYGDLMDKTGHAAKAVKLWKKGLELDPASADAHQRLALQHAVENRAGRAESHARAGLALASEDVASHASLAAARLVAGRPFAARALLRDALRVDPSNTTLEEAWIEADRFCRWIYLPMYYWGVVTRRLPGQQFFVWGCFVALMLTAQKLKWDPDWWGPVAFLYLFFCIYTWLAGWLVGLWTKLVPPRL